MLWDPYAVKPPEYWEGYDAFNEGKGMEDCPYVGRRNMYSFAEWEQGFIDAGYDSVNKVS